MRNEHSRAGSVSGVRELIGAEVLIIDGDDRVRKGMTQLLSAASLHVTAFPDPEEAFAALERKFFSVIVVDLDTPHPNAGLMTIEKVKILSPTSMVVVLTPRKAFDDAVSAIRAGAVDIILKSPESVNYLKDRVLDAAGRSVGKREVSSVLSEVKLTQDEFLELFVEAEKRALDLEDRLKGRDPNAGFGGEIRILVVGPDEKLTHAFSNAVGSNYIFEHVLTGGRALDRASASHFHIVMVSTEIGDLPSSMVTRSVKTQNPEVMVLEFSGPGGGGKVDIIDATRRRTAIEDFQEPQQFVDRLDELAEAFRRRARDRRYTQAFRERHYDFLRRFVELKMKIERALDGG